MRTNSTCKLFVTSGGNEIRPPFLGTLRSSRVPVGLVMDISVGRDAWRVKLNEMDPTLVARGHVRFTYGCGSPIAAIHGEFASSTMFSGRKRGRLPSQELAD